MSTAPAVYIRESFCQRGGTYLHAGLGEAALVAGNLALLLRLRLRRSDVTRLENVRREVVAGIVLFDQIMPHWKSMGLSLLPCMNDPDRVEVRVVLIPISALTLELGDRVGDVE